MHDSRSPRSTEPAPSDVGVRRSGCPVRDIRERLRAVGLRATRQRFALGLLIFGKGDRHFTAEALYEEALMARVPVSLATIYNTLKHFTMVGLLRQIAADGARAYFDTDVSDHHHFILEGGEPIDIDAGGMSLSTLPEPPEGMEIWRVDITVRIRRTQSRVERNKTGRRSEGR